MKTDWQNAREANEIIPGNVGPFPIEWVRTDAAWQTARITGLQFPLTPEEASALAEVFRELDAVIGAPMDITPLTYLVFAQMHLANGADLLNKNGLLWQPRMGLLVHPDQPPPTMWTNQDFERMPDDPRPMRPPVNNVLKLSCEPRIANDAAHACLAGGGVLRYYVNDARTFERKSETCLQPLLTDSIFQGFFFYLPVPSADSIAHASDLDLDTWLPEVRAVIAQEPANGSLLLLVRGNLEAALRQTNARLEKRGNAQA